MWVSFAVLFLFRYLVQLSQHFFCYPFSIWKNLFFLLLLLIQFSNIISPKNLIFGTFRHDAWKVHSKKDFSSKYFVSAPTNRNFAWLADLKGRTLSFTFLFHLSCKQAFLLRKEVIQPHLPIRLPCYDFTLIINPTFDCCLLTVSSQASGVIDSHGVTGGVYKARERIHRGMLIRDY